MWNRYVAKTETDILEAILTYRVLNGNEKPTPVKDYRALSDKEHELCGIHASLIADCVIQRVKKEDHEKVIREKLTEIYKNRFTKTKK